MIIIPFHIDKMQFLTECSKNYEPETLGVIWLDSCSFSPLCMGVVACKHGIGWQAFAGIGRGQNAEGDVRQIKRMGSRMCEHWARAFFPQIEGKYIW